MRTIFRAFGNRLFEMVDGGFTESKDFLGSRVLWMKNEPRLRIILVGPIGIARIWGQEERL